jgi:hypothetical protein
MNKMPYPVTYYPSILSTVIFSRLSYLNLILITWIWVLEKPQVSQLLKNFPSFYGIQRYIAMFTRAVKWSLSWVRWIQSIPPHHISLSSKVFLMVSVLLIFSPISYMHSSSPHECYMVYPSHSPSLDHSHYISSRVQVIMLLIMLFYPTSYHFICLWFKYSPQHSVLKDPQSMFLS